MAGLRDDLDGKRVQVAGRIFTGAIPDEYGIILPNAGSVSARDHGCADDDRVIG